MGEVRLACALGKPSLIKLEPERLFLTRIEHNSGPKVDESSIHRNQTCQSPYFYLTWDF